MTIVELLKRNARKTPEKTAIIFRDSKMSYRELNDTVNKIANFLLEVGVKKGDRVWLMLPRIPELVMGFLAAAKVQGIVVPINFELTHEEIRTIFENTSPQCIIAHTRFLDLARKSTPTALQPSIIEIGGSDEGCLCWNEIVRTGSANDPCIDVSEDDIVYLNYTSGSTGNSKGAVTTHANIYWNTTASVDALGLTHDDVHLCMFAPFAHPHELFSRSLYLGGTMVFVEKIYPKSLADAISTHKVTCMMGLAPMYENLLEVLEHKNYDLSSLRIPESGGMYTRSELMEKFKNKVGVPIIPVWGSTETTGVALANRPGDHIPTGSVGKPCLPYEIKIVNEENEEVPTGDIGEMLLKGPAVVNRYYDDTEASQETFKNGWYHSDDLVRKDERGNFYFVGRKKGMMKVAGLKVYPLEVELVLMSHPDIKEAVVVSAKDRSRGEIPKAIVVPNNGEKLLEKGILKFCEQKLARYKIPRIIEVRDGLPKKGGGKVNKRALQMEHR